MGSWGRVRGPSVRVRKRHALRLANLRRTKDGFKTGDVEPRKSVVLWTRKGKPGARLTVDKTNVRFREKKSS